MVSKLGLIIILLLIVLIIILIYVGYFVYQGTKILSKPKKYNSDKTVVLLKTHVWTDNLENYATKIKNETIAHGIDFYILMHCENDALLKKIKNQDLKPYILTFTEADIKKIYSKGFYSMWLSNHWILMWFYKRFGDKYKYFWSMEYDVRISGNSSKLWTYTGAEDFIYPIDYFRDPTWAWRNHYVGNKLADDQKYYGYLQLARYSNKFLEYLDQCFEAGENGQDELIMFSLFKRGKFSGSKKLLNKLIKNSWSVASTDSDKHKKLLEESDSESERDKNHIRIFHPIK